MSDKISKLASPITVDSTCKINIVGYSLDEFKTFNPDGYTIMCNLGEVCDNVQYFPNTSKIVLTGNSHSQLHYSFERDFLPNLAADLGVPQEIANNKAIDFFSTTEIRVQPVGVQGKLYNAMRTCQNYLAMVTSTNAVTALKTGGHTGLKIITQGSGPLVFVSITYLGSVVTGYAGSVAGDNFAGLVFNGTSWVLSRPMRGVEIVLNGIVLRPISHLTGLPVVLNGTQELLNGKGLDIRDYNKIGEAFEQLKNSKAISKAKEIYAILKR